MIERNKWESGQGKKNRVVKDPKDPKRLKAGTFPYTLAEEFLKKKKKTNKKPQQTFFPPFFIDSPFFIILMSNYLIQSFTKPEQKSAK